MSPDLDHSPSGSGLRRARSFGQRKVKTEAAKNDANPFKGKRPHRGKVPLTPLSLQLVVGARPIRLRDRVSSPLVKALAQKLWASPAEMYPLLLSTPLALSRARFHCTTALPAR